MQTILAVAVGGALGSVGRYLTVKGALALFGAGFPVGTLVVNILGSFLMGVAVSHFTTIGTGADTARSFWTAGFLGGFTTFSAFSYEAVTLYDNGNMAGAILYVAMSLVLALAALGAGLWVFRGQAL